jgi:hypothetical protein
MNDIYNIFDILIKDIKNTYIPIYNLNKKKYSKITFIEKCDSNNLTNIKIRGDVPRARYIINNDKREYILHKLSPYIIQLLCKYINKQFNTLCILSGAFLYKPGDYCGWHTNSDSLGKRLYLIWNLNDNKSFFNYQDNNTNKIISKLEKKGISHNIFNLSKNNNLWHCVGCLNNIRISIGFKFIKFVQITKISYNYNDIYECKIDKINNLNWRIIPKKDTFIYIKDVINLLNKEPIYIDHNLISFKYKNNKFTYIDYKYTICNIKYPNILCNIPNPHNLEYRMIFGDYRMLKIMSETNIKKSLFYIISPANFKKIKHYYL